MSLTQTSVSRRSFVAGATAFVAALGFGASFAFADEKKDAEKPADKPTVTLDGPFVIGFDQDFPPYGYVGDDGKYTGFDLDLAAAVAELEGWDIQLEPIAWDAKDALLNSGQITCIWNGFTIEGREDDYAFTAPYMENRQVIVVRADSGIEKLEDLSGQITCIWNGFTIEGREDDYAFTAPYMENRQVIVVRADSGIEKLEDLAGKVVLTQADSAALDLLSPDGAQADLGATFADLQTIGEYNTAFMMLETGAVDAVALDYPVAVFQIGDRKDDFLVLEEPLNSEHYGVGFAKGNEDLAAAVEADLITLYENGTVAELCEKYGDQGVSVDAWVLGVPKKDDKDADKAEAAAGLKDGEYTAEGKGIGGKVPVTVEVKDGKISAVTVGDNAETAGIGSKAIEQLPGAIVAANGTEGVDGVSGATITSKAIFTAVDDAIAQAQA